MGYPRALMGGCASSEPEKASTMQKQGETWGEAAAAKPDTATNGALPLHEENLMAFIDQDGDRNEFRPMNTTHLGWFVYKRETALRQNPTNHSTWIKNSTTMPVHERSQASLQTLRLLMGPRWISTLSCLPTARSSGSKSLRLRPTSRGREIMHRPATLQQTHHWQTVQARRAPAAVVRGERPHRREGIYTLRCAGRGQTTIGMNS